jgi:hypothetical protein
MNCTALTGSAIDTAAIARITMGRHRSGGPDWHEFGPFDKLDEPTTDNPVRRLN